ncbi:MULTISPECIES: tetratricopeptide repeat protein [unclassified Streptomyces]|uniref:tetratricopeptide repeat protein n=1 Tax=unclassified Streptomyces TaxID=2593676 RepID=UPI00380B4673
MDRLVSRRRRVSIVATINSGAKNALGQTGGGPTNSLLRADALRVIERAEVAGMFFVESDLSSREYRHAEALARDDDRLADALAHLDTDGFGARLAGGPAALARWQDARHGAEERGAAIIEAAINIRLAGFSAPIPQSTLWDRCPDYLHVKYPRAITARAFKKALVWSCTAERGTEACLTQVDGGCVEVFDYLVDFAQRTPGAAGSISEALWDAVLVLTREGGARGVGLAASRFGRKDVAERAFRMGVEAGQADCAYSLAVLMDEAGRAREAEALYRRAIAPEVVAGAVIPGDSERGEGLEPLSVRGFSDHGSGPLASLGLLVALAGRSDEAEDLLRQAVDAGEAGAMTHLGTVLYDAGYRDEAESVLRRGVAVGEPGAMASLGHLLVDTQRRQEGEDLIANAAQGGDPGALVALGVDMGGGDRERGRALIRQGAQTSVAGTIAGYGLMRILAWQGPDFYATGIDSKSSGARNNLGLLAARRGDMGGAEELFREAIEAGHTGAWINLGVLLDRSHRTDEAQDAFRQAIASGKAGAMGHLARHFARAGRTQEAEELYRQAIAAGLTEAQLGLGVLLARGGRAEEARPLLEQAVLDSTAHARENLKARLTFTRGAGDDGISPDAEAFLAGLARRAVESLSAYQRPDRPIPEEPDVDDASTRSQVSGDTGAQAADRGQHADRGGHPQSGR